MSKKKITSIIQFKGKRQRELACEEIKYRERKTSNNYQVTGLRGGLQDMRIGDLQYLEKKIIPQWEKEGVQNIQLFERYQDENGLYLKRFYR